jgi:hypothetical protein
MTQERIGFALECNHCESSLRSADVHVVNLENKLTGKCLMTVCINNNCTAYGLLQVPKHFMNMVPKHPQPSKDEKDGEDSE